MQSNFRHKKQGININKTKKLDLAKEFDQFKQKIQQFENKNEQIITRIREAYNFKKKNIQNYSPTPPELKNSRVVYYDGGEEQEQVQSSCDYSKNIVYDGNLMIYQQQGNQFPNKVDLGNRKIIGNLSKDQRKQVNMKSSSQKANRSYNRSHKIENEAWIAASPQTSPLDDIDPQKYQQLEMKRPKDRGRYINNPKSQQKISYKYLKEQEALQQKQKLLQMIERNKQLQDIIDSNAKELQKSKSVQSKLRSYSNYLKQYFCDQIENYQEQIIFPKYMQLEKYFRRYDNRLKKLNFRLKDLIQDRRAHKNIRKSRAKRQSVQKTDYKNSSNSSVQVKGLNINKNKDALSIFQSKQKERSQQNSENKIGRLKECQFSEIAMNYQNMVKSKIEEIQVIENKLRDQIRNKQKYASELSRVTMQLNEKQAIIEQLRLSKYTTKEQSIQQRQFKPLKDRILQLQEEIKLKFQKQNQLNQYIQKLQKAKKISIEQQRESFSKSINKKSSTISELEDRLRDCEGIYVKELTQIKEKLIAADKRNMEKDCEILSLVNKVKKIENECLVKDQKLKDFESLIAKEGENDILERSISIDNSLIGSNEFRICQQMIHRLEEEIQQKNGLIDNYQKSKNEQDLLISKINFQNQKLNRNVQELSKKNSKDQDKDANEKQLNKKIQDLITTLQESQKQRQGLTSQKEELLVKYSEIHQEIKQIRQQNLKYNRELIKLNSQLQFSRGQFSSLTEKFNKTKDQLKQSKQRLNDQQVKSRGRQEQLSIKIRQLQEQIVNYEHKITDLQGKGGKYGQEREEENLLNSLHTSEVSFHLLSSRGNQQNEVTKLKQRVKELQSILQLKSALEVQIQSQYKNNLQKIRADLTDKNQLLIKNQEKMQQLKKQMARCQQSQKEQISFQNYKINLYQQKIVQMQQQINTCKESEQKLNELLHELMENVKEKEEQMNKLSNQLQDKEKSIREMKELLQLKSSKASCNKQLDLSLINVQGNLRNSEDYNQEVSDVAELSYFSNISQVFKKDQFLQERMKKGKTTREEFIKLFTRTSAYIKSIKNLNQSKEKRIKVLERQLSNIKQEEIKNWSGVNQKQAKGGNEWHRTQEVAYNDDFLDQYKDYDSVQIDTRRSKSYQMIKQLQHEKQLAVEQNKMLLNQIELLQDEIARAEEQENNLVKIKDLYKEEIRKIMEKNQVHNKQFEIEIKRLQSQLEESQSHHNWEAIKQLFIKIIGTIVSLDEQSSKVKRDQKRKELEQYVKVLSSILRLDINVRDKLISTVKK